MNIDEAITIENCNSKLIIIGALFLDYTGMMTKINSTRLTTIEKGTMILSNIDTFKKLFKGFTRPFNEKYY